MASGTRKRGKKNNELVLERAVIIVPYEAQVRKTQIWHEGVRDWRVQEFWCIQKPAILNEHTNLNNSKIVKFMGHRNCIFIGNSSEKLKVNVGFFN